VSAQHTPGPWAFNDEAHRIESDAPGYPNDGWAICELMGQDIIGNARLIAAAPDMLAALTDLVLVFDARPDIMDKIRPLMGWAEHGALNMARAAIAKVS